jgi:hypothetical protein
MLASRRAEGKARRCAELFPASSGEADERIEMMRQVRARMDTAKLEIMAQQFRAHLADASG